MDRLDHLPKDLKEAYNAVFERMTPGEADFAYRILGWILHARRILKMSELREALAAQIGHSPSFDPLFIANPIEIVRTWGGLISYDEASSLVTFSHETVCSFLEREKLGVLSSHSVLFKTCLTYLQLPEFENPCNERQEFDERLDKVKFSNYAARYWATHAVQSQRDVEWEAAILETLSSKGRREAIAQLKFYDYTRSQSLFHVLIQNHWHLSSCCRSQTPKQSSACMPLFSILLN